MLLKLLRRSLAALLLAVALPAAAAEDLAGKFTKLAAPAPAPQATFQDADGNVEIPKALHRYLDGAPGFVREGE